MVTGEWRLKQMSRGGYFPIAGTFWMLGALGQLPRVKRSTQGEGHERRYFYGSVWAVTDRAAGAVASVEGPAADDAWLMSPSWPCSSASSSFVGNLARLGALPRTRPIVPGELAGRLMTAPIDGLTSADA